MTLTQQQIELKSAIANTLFNSMLDIHQMHDLFSLRMQLDAIKSKMEIALELLYRTTSEGNTDDGLIKPGDAYYAK